MAADTIARVAWKPWESSASRTAPTAASAMMNWGPRVQRRRPARLKRSQKAVDKASRQSSRNSARSPPATSPRSTRMQRLARRESQRSRNSRRTAGGARRPAMRNFQQQSIGGGTGSEWDMMPLLTHSTPDSLMMFPGRGPWRYGISHFHFRAAGKGQRRRRAGAVARFRTPPAAAGGVDSLQAESPGADVLRGGRPGAGDLPAGVPRYRQLHLSVARQLPALAFGHHRPRHRRPRAVPEPGASGGRGSAFPVGQQSAGAGTSRQPDSQPAVRPARGGGPPAQAHGRAAGGLPAGTDPGENRRPFHGGDGGAAGQVARGGSAIGVPRPAAVPRAVPGDPRLMDEARERQLAEALAHLMDGDRKGDAETRSRFPELAGELD